MRYLGLAALAIPVWLLFVLGEVLGKSVEAAKSNSEPRGTHLFPAPVIISWALVALAYISDSRWFSQEPSTHQGFWLVFSLLIALAVYAAAFCIHSALALRAYRRQQSQ